MMTARVHLTAAAQVPVLCLPGTFSALEGVVFEQGEDRAVIGQQPPCYVDHPLTLLVGLGGDTETGC